MTAARDFIGREIKANDLIVYPVRRGSNMWLNRLTVQQVTEGARGPVIAGTNAKGRRVNITNIDNVVVVQPLPTPEPAV